MLPPAQLYTAFSHVRQASLFPRVLNHVKRPGQQPNIRSPRRPFASPENDIASMDNMIINLDLQIVDPHNLLDEIPRFIVCLDDGMQDRIVVSEQLRGDPHGDDAAQDAGADHQRQHHERGGDGHQLCRGEQRGAEGEHGGGAALGDDLRDRVPGRDAFDGDDDVEIGSAREGGDAGADRHAAVDVDADVERVESGAELGMVGHSGGVFADVDVC